MGEGLPRWRSKRISLVMQETRVRFPRWESSSAGGNGHRFQCSCLENSTDRGAWRATVHGVAKSPRRLSMQARTPRVRPVYVRPGTVRTPSSATSQPPASPPSLTRPRHPQALPPLGPPPSAGRIGSSPISGFWDLPPHPAPGDGFRCHGGLRPRQ